MAKKLRTFTDPSEVEGLEPGGELGGRELLDSRPMAVPIKPVRDGLGPLDKMYAEIRAREAARLDSAYEETEEEREDFEIPEELDEFLSKYEEQPIELLLGSAFKDQRVQAAIKAALEGTYGPREMIGLAEFKSERDAKRPEAPNAAGDPSAGNVASGSPAAPPAGGAKP